MEGYLKKWTNIVHRWKTRYFILKNSKLQYRKYKYSEVKGEIEHDIKAQNTRSEGDG